MKNERSLKEKYRWSNRDTTTLKIWLILIIVFISFESLILNVFDNKILSFISFAEASILPFILVLVASITYCIFKFCNWYTNKVFTPYRYLISLSFLISIYTYYRWITKQYVSYPNYSDFGAIDLIVLALICIILFRFFLNMLLINSIKNPNTELIKDYFEDFPIRTKNSDLLMLEEKVNQVKSRIDQLSMNSQGSTSIGIIGKWGQGKSSFLALLYEKYQNQQQNVIVNFNPRYSKDIQSIQFDFFELLISKNVASSDTFNKYLNAIKVIDKTRIIEALSNSPIFHDKELTKGNLNSELKKNKKKIIVFIDDLDRLQAEEIIEVFKILDYTASFSNIVFVTAFDKDYINGILDAKYHKAENYFSDKFFNKEIFLAPIGKDIIYNYLYGKLQESFDKSTDEFDKISATLYLNKDIISKVFLTLRDVKRFLNIFTYRYLKLKGFLDFNDLFLLYILKSKWYDFYLFLYRECYNIHDEWSLDTYINESNKISVEDKILEKYFELETAESYALQKHKSLIKSILEKLSFIKTSRNEQPVIFENYFQEYEGDAAYKLTHRYIERFVNKELNSIKSEIDWYFDEKKFNELCLFIGNFDISTIGNKDQLANYLALLIYINSRSDNHQSTYFQLLKFFNKEDTNVKEIKQIIEISDEDYKKLLLEELDLEYPYYPKVFIRNLISKLFPSQQTDGEIIISSLVTNHEILKLTKKYFEDYCKKNQTFKKGHLDILYNCIEDIKMDLDRKIILDKEICTKVEKLIRQDPTEYFKILLNSQYEEVYIESFYLQIFESNEEFEKFMMDEQYDNIDNINLVRNYWKLYKNNGYKPLSFDNLGSVKQKIDNEFRNEIKQLDQIFKLKKEFEEVESNISSFLNEVPEIGKENKYLKPEDVLSFCSKHTIDIDILLKNLKKIKELINKAHSTEFSYFPRIKILDDLKYYEVIKLKLDETGSLNDFLDNVKMLDDNIKLISNENQKN